MLKYCSFFVNSPFLWMFFKITHELKMKERIIFDRKKSFCGLFFFLTKNVFFYCLCELQSLDDQNLRIELLEAPIDCFWSRIFAIICKSVNRFPIKMFWNIRDILGNSDVLTSLLMVLDWYFCPIPIYTATDILVRKIIKKSYRYQYW